MMQFNRAVACRFALVRQIACCSCGHRTRPMVMKNGCQISCAFIAAIQRSY